MLDSSSKFPISRRRFLAAGACAAGGLALYSGEIERHFIEISPSDVFLPGLPRAFDGFRIAQISDIHLDEFTEPIFVRDAVNRVNSLNPDAVFITGDFVTSGLAPEKFAIGAAWQCAGLLDGLTCRQRYAVLGNHDVMVGPRQIIEALADHGITVLRNAHLPLERSTGRIWLAGLDDPLQGAPLPEVAIPESIRNIPHEPIVLMCHAPDYADKLLIHPAGPAVALMLCGHTHGGQIRLPWIGAMVLPEMGRKYIEGWFRLNQLQLHVNRGIGTVGLPFRFDCPPEISLLTLRSA
ncbi:MAG: metallophosphoesterase [Terracidiphilus sp.]